MKQILILGGGFAGIAAALELRKHKEALKYHITLIDENPYHLFTPSLYEVATSEEPQKNIAIPFNEIFEKDVEVVKGTVQYIHPKLRRVYVEKDKQFPYDYLILALGSQPAYYNIPGLEHYSIPLKKLPDAVTVKETIKNKYHEKIKNNEILSIVIGGGGFSGTELAAELAGYKERLNLHHKKSEKSISITVIQGSDCLLKELDKKISIIAQQRLAQEGIHIVYKNHIQEVTHHTITTDAGKIFQYDVFIWTGGVKANTITHTSGFAVNPRGQITVNQYLQTEQYPEVYAVGDISDYINPLTKSAIPNVAPAAEAQGKAAAVNIYRQLKNLPLLTFHFVHIGYIVPLRGRYAVAQFMNISLSGFTAWILQQFVFLYYLLSILPLPKACKKWNKFERQLEC